MHRAMSLSSLGQHQTALEVFHALSGEKPELGGLDAAWARALERSSRPKEAEALLLKAFESRPSVELLEAIGGFYDRQNRNAEAVSLFTSASQRQPKDEALTFALATALERLGAWQKSVEKMRTVLEANPANTAAMNFIGYTLADHGGDLDEAEKLVKRALDTRPDSAAYLDSMGWVLYKRGEFDKAVEFLDRAVTEAPDEATLLEHLGDAAMRSSKRVKAVEAFKHALQLVVDSPENVDRRSQRADLERKLRSLTN
jgi:tetratricopeptide (TPR) repeat protein